MSRGKEKEQNSKRMIRGMSFRAANPDYHVLGKILKNVKIEEYTWYMIEGQSEVWAEAGEEQGNCFFDKAEYQGEEFRLKIQGGAYIIFLKLEAYSQGKNQVDLCSYEEFQKSGCKILILIYDCEFIEVYVKGEELLERIHQDVIDNQFRDVSYISDCNDERETWNVR